MTVCNFYVEFHRWPSNTNTEIWWLDGAERRRPLSAARWQRFFCSDFLLSQRGPTLTMSSQWRQSLNFFRWVFSLYVAIYKMCWLPVSLVEFGTQWSPPALHWVFTQIRRVGDTHYWHPLPCQRIRNLSKRTGAIAIYWPLAFLYFTKHLFFWECIDVI